ncbi:hypothetical protein DFQ11_10470 [Winogradskyella epiphytica]|uniref:Uncharacterized protein n=1 Tax=Winogradskyella epiphytica TaxID=262005 RepID=A0A2V4XE18_9FLAO|nr:hypothetical protein [Winogradskyella epiphytica]PYE80704.1 hypothetical protein DFQ11_10470 [Winogradskyella epiphytica]GGW67832.1 hypothetical protein GCM10008085_19660 [Winogradskyella epiphytica]
MENNKATFAHFKLLKKWMVFFIPVLLTFSCSLDDDGLATENIVESNTSFESTNYVPYVLSYDYVSYNIGQDNLYGAGLEGFQEGNIIIKDPSSWIGLMNQMDLFTDVTQQFSETDINFEQFLVVAVFDHLYNSTGQKIHLEVEYNSDNIIVSIIKSRRQGRETYITTQPFQILKIPLTNLPIVFHHRISK